jgi:hypothetical protein
MMKNILLIILTTLVSCEISIKEFDIEEPNPKLAAYSFAFPDSVPKIYISKNYRITQEMTFEPVENVHIELYHHDNLLGTLEQENDFYTNPSILLETNKTYRYSFTKDGFPSAEATFYIPDKPLVNKIDSQLVMDHRLTGRHSFYENCFLRFTINFNDNPKTKDYYSIQVIDKYVDYDNTCYIEERVDMQSQTTFIDIIEDDGIYATKANNKVSYGKRFFFSDQLINGKKENNLVVQIPINPIGTGMRGLFDLTICFSKIDQHFFEHVKSKGKQYGTQIYNDIDVGIPLAEPVSTYSNVSNGLGIVAGTNDYINTFYQINKFDLMRWAEKHRK